MHHGSIIMAGLVAMLFAGGVPAQTTGVNLMPEVANGADTVPAPWQVIQMDRKYPPTRYRLREWEGVTAIEAEADASMALLARPLDIDLNQTPVLCWQWRIDEVVASADITRRSGDDYAARVYVSFRLPAADMSAGTRFRLGLARRLFGAEVPDAAVNYVWDNRQPPGTMRPNAYTDRARMLVLRSGNAEAGHWVTERRDVMADFERAFGNRSGQPVQLAIATDTDNTGEKARAGFAGLQFVAGDHECATMADAGR